MDLQNVMENITDEDRRSASERRDIALDELLSRIEPKLENGTSILNVQRKSNHPAEWYLYLVKTYNPVTENYGVYGYNYSADTVTLYDEKENHLTLAESNEVLAKRTRDVYNSFVNSKSCEEAFKAQYGCLPLDYEVKKGEGRENDRVQ